MTYLDRNIEHKINELLNIFPAVVIIGTRQCGKTKLAKKMRPDWSYFDLEFSQVYGKIANDPSFFFKENSENLILDEAQIYSDLFKELRGGIDQSREVKNRFIITGSSSLELMKNVSESLAGRLPDNSSEVRSLYSTILTFLRISHNRLLT